MPNYIDGFILPVPRKHLEDYKSVAQKVSEIWKEHGALSYHEYVGDDMQLAGTLSFPDCLDAKEDEVVIFGWVEFASREIRDHANKKVASDYRMEALVAPLTNGPKVIFDAQRMAYGGFKSLVE